jgi:drug/metabolite transporter (DMT)-like permease
MSVHLILVIVQVCFASLAVVGKLALADVPPLALVLARVAGGALVFWILARGAVPLRLGRRDWLRLVACAHLGVVFNQILFLNGLERSTAINASVLGTTIPIFTALFAAAAGAERLRAGRVAGIVVALAGALILVRVDRFSLSDEHAVGNLLIVANSCCYGLFLVTVRPLAARIAPMPLVTLVFACALPVVAVLGVPVWSELAPRLSGRDAALVAFIIAVPTVGAYALNQIAIRRADSSVVAVYIYLQPLLAAVGASFLLHELPDRRTLLGAALIFPGVWLSARSRSAPA